MIEYLIGYIRINNHNSHVSGSGIGLAMTKELVKSAGGNIRVRSEPDQGSTFSVELPISQNAPPIAIEDQKPVLLGTLDWSDRETESDMTILVVEDHDDVAEYIYSCLHRQYHCVRANNGAEGLKLTLEIMPDIIISDVMMPVMDGIAMLESIRKDFRINHIPTIL